MRVGITAFFIGLCLMALTMSGSNWDESVFLAIGDLAPSRAHTEAAYGRTPVTRPDLGHDGQVFFLQALDPWYSSVEHATVFDKPVYRARRMLYPAIVGLGGTAPAWLIPWLMGLTSAAAFGVGSAAFSNVARRRGLNRWWGLGFILNLGLLMEVLIGGAGVVALALAVVGMDALDRNKQLTAGLAFAAAILTREVMVIFVVGVALSQWRSTRQLPWQLLVPGFVLSVSWEVFIRLRIGSLGLPEPAGGAALSAPFKGLISAANLWRSDYVSNAPLVLFTIALLVWVVVAAPSSADPFVWGAVGYALLAPFLSDFVWGHAGDVSRAVEPVYLALVLTVAVRLADSRAEPATSGDSSGPRERSTAQTGSARDSQPVAQ